MTPISPFSESELQRYARHIALREIGGPGQARIRAANILVVGAGGLGSPVLLYLAAAGVGNLAIFDDDEVSLSNLQRQIVHCTQNIGKPKVTSAKDTLLQINPHVKIAAREGRVDEENADSIVKEYDMVIDGSDNLDTRRAINTACFRSKIPLIYGALGQWEGQISLFRPWLGGPCYSCLFSEENSAAITTPSCADGGVVGALAGTIGSIMALEAIKLITGAGQTLDGSLIVFDALNNEWHRWRLSKKQDCEVCANH